MKEVWKDVPDYEGLYQVSNFGMVKRLQRKIPYGYGMRNIPEKVLKNNVNECGYLYVRLHKGAKSKNHKIHRLVAQAFIENPEHKRCVNHKDGNKQNNFVENLEWATHSENMKHAADNKLWVSWNLGKHYTRKKPMSEETKIKISNAKKEYYKKIKKTQ